ncbi:MAG: 1-acyl-sn-glycerol-3-phosphate acyltransferase [Acidobacteriota bacterium]
MRTFLTLLFLRLLSWTSGFFYSHQLRWVGEVPEEPWAADFRLVVILNHTSLIEVILSSIVPDRFLRRLSRHGVVPVADKTINRPLMGPLFKVLAQNVVPLSRERDETWQELLAKVDDDAMVIILPEGRMKRANGLDSHGKPLTLRGGIADLLQAMGSGPMLICYNEGMHHIQIPEQGLPKLFKTFYCRLERLDIAEYIAARHAEADASAKPGPKAFRRAVVADLTRRRDRWCAPEARTPDQPVTATAEAAPSTST